MAGDIIRISSISALHEAMGIAKPKHPLITVVDAGLIHIAQEQIGIKIITDLYMISLKDRSCGIEYGRNSFDFDEGVMVFSGPGQTYSYAEPVEAGSIQGWMLYFHPDLIRNTHLGEIIDEYSFFSYDVFEALHLSEEEENTINECLGQIVREYEQRIDKHSQRVIVSTLELLLNYALRFYERQFNTRRGQSRDIISAFSKELKAWFGDGRTLEHGLPTIQHFSESANLSQHYFSDLIKKETGRSPRDHINEYVVERAKSLLLGSEQSVSEIAYKLGFNYPHYFTRLFKAKTGHTPVEYRNLN